jgi:hypothetical protein
LVSYLLTLAPEIAIPASERETHRERERERERQGERQQEHEGFFAIAAETRSFLKEIHICCWVL